MYRNVKEFLVIWIHTEYVLYIGFRKKYSRFFFQYMALIEVFFDKFANKVVLFKFLKPDQTSERLLSSIMKNTHF